MTQRPPETIDHGGDLEAARAAFPHAPEPWIDLSTGINPRPYPLPDIPVEAWTRLPQVQDARRLRLAATHRYGAADPECVVPAPGTQALIQILPRLVRSTRVAVLAPTYAEHAAAWGSAGHDVVEIADIEQAGAASVVVLVNPNNPTGRLVPNDRLRALARALDARGGLLVVDEAFADMLPAEASVVAGLPPAAVVLRSFGKTYGLAGLRLGFAIANKTFADRIRAALGPWAVAGPALTIGAAALADDAWLEETRRRLEVDARRLDALLAQSGCDVLGGTPLFRLAACQSAARLADTTGSHGIHVRRFSYAPTWLRFGLPGTEEAWARLERALREASRS